MRVLFATLSVLVALSVPVAAAAFSEPATAAVPAAAAAAGPTRASADVWITTTPPPLLVMLLGTLVVAVTIMRHLRTRRSPLTISAGFDRRQSMPTVH